MVRFFGYHWIGYSVTSGTYWIGDDLGMESGLYMSYPATDAVLSNHSSAALQCWFSGIMTTYQDIIMTAGTVIRIPFLTLIPPAAHGLLTSFR